MRVVAPSDSRSAFFVTARVNERVSLSDTIGLAAYACIVDDGYVATHHYFYQAERARTEEHLTSQLRQRDIEIQQQVVLTRTQLQEKDVQILERETELREAWTQLQQKDIELNTVQLNFEVHII